MGSEIVLVMSLVGVMFIVHGGLLGILLGFVIRGSRDLGRIDERLKRMNNELKEIRDRLTKIEEKMGK
jgi:hypothetical protein